MNQDEFYHSRAWVRTRQAYIDKRVSIDGGICEVCHDELGLIVHHKIWINDQTCNDPEIALNLNNLRYECQKCHNREINPEGRIPARIGYGQDGEIISLE